MNFLLIPKNGKPRFHTGDPFDYIKKCGMIPVRDYFNEHVDDILKEFLPMCQLYMNDNYCYGLIIFNEKGDSYLKERENELNMPASNFFNAYGQVYLGNYCKIKSDSILVKTLDGKQLVNMTREDKRKVKKMLEEASWIEQYLDRDEWYQRQ